MNLGVRFARARTLDEYCDAGYLFAGCFAVAGAWLAESLGSNAPLVGPFLASLRETLKEVLGVTVPGVRPVLRYLVSLPVLVLALVVVAAASSKLRRYVGRVFANGFLVAASALFASIDFFFRRRGVAALVLGVLGGLVPLGFVRVRAAERDREAAEQAYQRWLSNLRAFVDRTTLSSEDAPRVQRLLDEWDGMDVAEERPVSSELVATLKLLYDDSKRKWDERISLASKRSAKANIVRGDDVVPARAHQVVLARARLRSALGEQCSSASLIDDAARTFQGTRDQFPKSAAYGLSACYGCGFDYLVRAPGATGLKLCASPAECAKLALQASAADETEGDEDGPCSTVELKRRNNRLDVLVRLAANFEELGYSGLPEARDKARLLKEIATSEDLLIRCGQLHRLRDSLAFRTLAEARAAAFGLRAPDNVNARREDTEESARWLLTARMVAPPGIPDWDMRPFCGMLADADAKRTFVGLLGSRWVGACP